MMEFESSTQLFSQAAILMLVGMMFVFAFLTFLILVIKYILTPLGSRFPDVAVAIKDQNESHNTAPVVAAISAAIKQYRTKHK